jgi:hypothetical protein
MKTGREKAGRKISRFAARGSSTMPAGAPGEQSAPGRYQADMPSSTYGVRVNYVRTLSLLAGVLLVIEGVWGFYSPVVFGVLRTNTLHASIHIVLGAVGLWASTSSHGHPRIFLVSLGLLLIAVGLLWIAPASRGWLESVLNPNEAVAVTNLVTGGLCVLVGLTRRRVELPLRGARRQ